MEKRDPCCETHLIPPPTASPGRIRAMATQVASASRAGDLASADDWLGIARASLSVPDLDQLLRLVSDELNRPGSHSLIT